MTQAEMISLEKGDGAVSESEVKAGLNGANGFRMPLFEFPRIALPGMFDELAKQGSPAHRKDAKR